MKIKPVQYIKWTRNNNAVYHQNVLYEECCTRIYSSYNYHGIEGAEKQYDRMLSGHDGGFITIEDKNGNIVKTVLGKLKKDGQDIIYD